MVAVCLFSFAKIRIFRYNSMLRYWALTLAAYSQGVSMIKPLEFIKLYRDNRKFYYPMIDLEHKRFYMSEDDPVLRIGFDCGAIGKRPYFVELVIEYSEFLTYYISTQGIENYSRKQVLDMLKGAGIYHPLEGEPRPKMYVITDDDGNDFFEIDVRVPDGYDDLYVEGGGSIYSFSNLTDFNKTKK